MRRVTACILATCVLAATLGRGQAAVKAYTPASWSAAVRQSDVVNTSTSHACVTHSVSSVPTER